MAGARILPGARHIITSLLVAAVCCATATGTTIYVDAGATGANTGTRWEHALDSLQDALLLAYFLEKPVEVRVARGTYRPDRGLGIMPGDLSASFELMNGVAIRGGYAGANSLDPDARDIAAYPTILSGSIITPPSLGAGPDGIYAGAQQSNSHHVVTGSGADSTAVLDGVTITAGTGDNGGGMFNDDGSPTLIHCTFRDNTGQNGAGLYNLNGSRPVLNYCTFTANRANSNGGAIYNSAGSPTLTGCTFIDNSASSGGALYNDAQSRPALTDCTFRSNSSRGAGGAVFNAQGSPDFAGCIFQENEARLNGAGILNDGGAALLLNCTFRANAANGNGGALYNRNGGELTTINCLFTRNGAGEGGAILNYATSFLTLTNCTFTANTAAEGGAIYCGYLGAHTTVTNCILWANTPDEIFGGGATTTYSNVQGRPTGEGNISADPLFADPDGDFHLKSQAGRWDPAAGRWVLDEVSSPCIDAGDPAGTTGFEPFPNGNFINMGVYGGTAEASLSPAGLVLMRAKASNPSPPDGALGVFPSISLSWDAGLSAVAHDVYLSVEFEAVAEAGRSDPRGALVSQNQSTTSYRPSLLSSSRIYWWRVDEVDHEGHITKGDVWRFTTSTGPAKGRSCFTPETPVWVDGRLVAIAQVQPAQNVRAACSEAGAGRMVIRPCGSFGAVERLQEHQGAFACYDVLLETGNGISVVSGHYFMTADGHWAALQDLRAGMSLRTATGSVAIAAVSKRPTPYVGKVYNLKIENSDSYLVGKDALIVRDY
jgi:predicted outer membrane repeat protein